MIDFDEARRARVRKLLGERRFTDGFAGVYKILTQSYKVASFRDEAARSVGAIGFLFTGEPAAFETIGATEALALAHQLFTKPERDGRGGLLLRHAQKVLGVVPSARRGYVDLENDHVTLLGGSYLFQTVVTALVEPYVERSPMQSSAHMLATDVRFWIRPEVIAAGTKGRRAWPEWLSHTPSDEEPNRARGEASDEAFRAAYARVLEAEGPMHDALGERRVAQMRAFLEGLAGLWEPHLPADIGAVLSLIPKEHWTLERIVREHPSGRVRELAAVLRAAHARSRG